VIPIESILDRHSRWIDATAAQIDKLVYELYEVTPDEIKSIEELTTERSQ